MMDQQGVDTDVDGYTYRYLILSEAELCMEMCGQFGKTQQCCVYIYRRDNLHDGITALAADRLRV